MRLFFDGISFKSIRMYCIIGKKRHAVRHTFEGLINCVRIRFVIINPSKVCRTAERLFSMIRMLLKLIPSKKAHNKLIFILLKFIADKGRVFL